MTAIPLRCSLVVSTIGRPEELSRLLDSLDRLVRPSNFELVLVDQTDDEVCTNLVRRRAREYPTICTTSPLGLSRGRNAGLAVSTGDLVAFPDDDCWYAPDTLVRVRSAFAARPGLDLVSGMQTTADGRPSMLRWSSTPGPITRRNFLRTSISSTLFLRRRLVAELGGFDDRLGAGSGTGFGSGEESDLVLRAIEHGAWTWYDPTIVVYQDEPRDRPVDGFDQKMRGYGRGFGLLFRRHRLGWPRLGYYLGRKSAGVLVRTLAGRRDLAAADLAFIRGSIGGYRSGDDR